MCRFICPGFRRSDVGRRRDTGCVPDEEPSEDTVEGSVLALIKSVVGTSAWTGCPLRSASFIRSGAGLPGGLFADVAPRVVAGWRPRATAESLSHLRDHRSR